MLAHISSLNFYKSKERKYQQNLKSHNRDGNKVQMELDYEWISNFELIIIKKSHRKLVGKCLHGPWNLPIAWHENVKN